MSTEIKVGDVVSHDKYADDDRFLVLEVEDGVATAAAIDPDTGQAPGRSVLFAVDRLARCGGAWVGWR